ncbi:hypothetical protein MC885_008202 [Smutsia gigantea]|nr:hypothetical protein MC885_008202 [Smutsia gigantea]
MALHLPEEGAPPGGRAYSETSLFLHYFPVPAWPVPKSQQAKSQDCTPAHHWAEGLGLSTRDASALENPKHLWGSQHCTKAKGFTFITITTTTTTTTPRPAGSIQRSLQLPPPPPTPPHPGGQPCSFLERRNCEDPSALFVHHKVKSGSGAGGGGARRRRVGRGAPASSPSASLSKLPPRLLTL